MKVYSLADSNFNLPGRRLVACFCLVLFSAVVSGFGWAQSATASKAISFEQLSKQASAAWTARNYEEAFVLYGKAVKLRPSWKEGWGYLASSLYSQKRFS